ncbi:MAG: M20/M25/M40 family metallo-hydrolase [Phycisphaerae bacterium]|nr:M20/M25/M40 family metallo-hydrolase [Phycisphaerae bacterium]
MERLSEMEKDRVRGLLADLVRIDSAVTSTEQANRDRTEERIADFVSDRLRRMGMTVARQEVFPGRPNLIAHWRERVTGKRLVLEAHLDTVTVEGMTVEPFAAEVRDGRMYGRGTCDTKGSMAAFLTALELAYHGDMLPADQIYFVASMSEETGCDGAAALMDYGFRADAAIVGEPTGCELVTCHKGPLWMEVETRGRSCHASVPDRGVNAIDLMARVVEFTHGPWLEYIRQVSHPLLGRSTAQVTLIQGGAKGNIIPARCRAFIDSRLIPWKASSELLADFERMLAAYVGDERCFAIESVRTLAPLDTPVDGPLARRLLDLCREANGQEGPRGVNYFADSGPFSSAGIPSVLIGPGDIAQAHTADEYLDLDQLYQATEIMLTLLTQNAGRSILAES